MEITWQPVWTSHIPSKESLRLYVGNTWIETIRDKKSINIIKSNITQYTTTNAAKDDLLINTPNEIKKLADSATKRIE